MENVAESQALLDDVLILAIQKNVLLLLVAMGAALPPPGRAAKQRIDARKTKESAVKCQQGDQYASLKREPLR